MISNTPSILAVAYPSEECSMSHLEAVGMFLRQLIQSRLQQDVIRCLVGEQKRELGVVLGAFEHSLDDLKHGRDACKETKLNSNPSTDCFHNSNPATPSPYCLSLTSATCHHPPVSGPARLPHKCELPLAIVDEIAHWSLDINCVTNLKAGQPPDNNEVKPDHLYVSTSVQSPVFNSPVQVLAHLAPCRELRVLVLEVGLDHQIKSTREIFIEGHGCVWPHHQLLIDMCTEIDMITYG